MHMWTRLRNMAAALGVVLVCAAGLGVGQALLVPAVASAAPTTSLFNSAQYKFAHRDVPGGLGDIAALLRIAPDDAQALALQAIWADYVYDFPLKAAAQGRLNAVSPATAAGVNRVFGAIGAGVATLPNPFPSVVGPQTAIVALGYGLLDNGAMRPELEQRMGAVWRQAIIAPFSPIVVTGGAPHNGVTEAAAMRNWLVARGIPASRILTESRAGSTVQNALFTAAMVRPRGVVNAVVVSSSNHVRRAVTDFVLAGLPVIGVSSQVEGWLDAVLPPLRDAQLSIYVDATRTFGVPATR
ncbi:YdcF family protein [Williamsia sp. M5A3_1d]